MLLLFTNILSSLASEQTSFSELSESDFFDRDFRILHIDIIDNSPLSIKKTLNILDSLEIAVQQITNVNLSIIQYFDLITANFDGSFLALLLTYSEKGVFPKYRVSNLKTVHETNALDLVELASNMLSSQTCVDILFPTHDQKSPFISTEDISSGQVCIEQLFHYFNNQEKIHYKNKILEKQEKNDERVEAEAIISSEALIMNKCEIWSIGNNSKMTSSAYQIADWKRISFEKLIITEETYDLLAKRLTTDFKIETILSKTLPWFYYYTEKYAGEELDLSKPGFPNLNARDLFSLKSLIKNNNHIKKIKFLDNGTEKIIPISLLDILEYSEPQLSMTRLFNAAY